MMARRWVRILFVAGMLASHGAGAQARPARLLTPAQLEQPAQVRAWLRHHAKEADLERAETARQEGVEDARRGDRGAALKGYGESAIWFPSPAALMDYADAMERFLGALRRHRENRAQYIDSDLHRLEQLYRSAVASDDVLGALAPRARREAVNRAACIARYRKNGKGLAGCAPLAVYGLRD